MRNRVADSACSGVAPTGPLPRCAGPLLRPSQALPLERLPRREPGGRLGLLRGIRVLDLTTSLAGPYATMLLGDFGAEVIKVERPGTGDDSRHWTPPSYAGQALWYLSVNRNKRSVTLDFSKPDGLALLKRLIERCDVLVTNQLPRALAKLGVDYASAKAVRPDIVYVSLTGFGLGGDRQNDPCYDLIAEGYSGVMAIWRRFCAVVERADLAADPGLATNAGRVARRKELVETIQRLLIEKPRAHWLVLFRANKVPAGPINRVDEVVRDEELLARGLFYSMENGAAPIPQVGLGIRFDGEAPGYEQCPPALGADTISVLRELADVEPHEIDSYKQAGVI